MKIQLGEKTTRLIGNVHKINGWQNRAVYGVTAIASQPFFDYKNPSVDETTQKYSLVKTLIKIIVGTTVGIASRATFQKWGEKLYDKGKFEVNNLGIKNIDKAKFKRGIGNVFSIIGALLAMFSVDIIVSNYLLSHFSKKINQKSRLGFPAQQLKDNSVKSTDEGA